MRKAQKEAEEEETSSEEEDDLEKRERLRKTEQEADLKHAEDLFGEVGISNKRSAPRTVVVVDDKTTADASQSKTDDGSSGAIDLSRLPIFKPKSKGDFEKMSQIFVPLITANQKHPQYSLSFLPDFVKQISKDLPSTEIKKLSSAIGLLLNEKLKEEKAADKGGKKSKAAKTKSSLVANRDTSHKADVTAYDDGLEE